MHKRAHSHVPTSMSAFQSVCHHLCAYLSSGWQWKVEVVLRGRWRWRRLVVRLCEWDVRVPLVSVCLAQVATGRPTSLASKRKQRKMLCKKVPSLICKATTWHIRNLYAQLTTGRLIFPLPLSPTLSLPLSLSLALDQTEQSPWIEATLNAQHVYELRAYFRCVLFAQSGQTNSSDLFRIYSILQKTSWLHWNWFQNRSL